MLNRTFFALTLNKSQKNIIEQWRQCHLLEVDADKVPLANLHLNLAFLGHLTEHQIDALFELVNNIKFDPITIDINTLGHWSDNKILWVGSSQQNEGFSALSEKLKSIGETLKLEMDNRTYVPHISIYRNCRYLPTELDTRDLDFEFTFDTFVLFQTLTLSHGVDYHILRHWKADNTLL